ncbi:SGNH/GDSL hydrolase family protein [Gracilimonas sp.]|uniref:SGNH/GDSL hydrolase family protein n=1 Tax=Gracilimonas sp. TaxID=1974203 RepID=UPI00287122DB|nr:SGNH/GDSL hydrolase family protein [Gracilimonas sp.]
MNFKAFFSNIFILINISLLLLSGCNNDVKKAENPNSSPEIESISYLALGDSYTIGTGINPEQSWPYQLRDSLQTLDIPLQKTDIIAVNGWTTADLQNGINEAKPDSAYDLVSLLIGVNNQYQGMDIDFYRKEFRELLEQAITFANSDADRIFVISIPNYGVTPFAESRNPDEILQEIETYNDIAEKIAAEYNIPIVNITSISELAAKDSTLLASDELHPSAKMYAMWVEKMLPTVTQIIQP